ncbi:ArnT family glycosyltransferase [Thermoactinospora rubra]|uniref:ArnT family glycosyltransferase n=1 Tax=Thermoactinospora rubra TaxID=1088767 RepID=UPI000A11803F|nr:glycosyltransferase family 39 protein [Thermoactinospora rubra]
MTLLDHRPAHRAPAGKLRRAFTSAVTRALTGSPAWSRPARWAVLLAAFVLYAWGLSGNANEYYAAAVLSAAKSWKAFFFGALDAGSFITVDKPPLAIWVMALSARIFGLSTWSMLLPQAVAGVAAVALVHSAVRRSVDGVAGHVAALIAAVAMTLTPVTVAINRDNNPDTLLVLTLVAAAWCCLEAVRAGRVRRLLWCAFFVGLGFNTKMLQAFVVLPAFALAYLVCARTGVRKRVGHLLAAGAVLAVSSGWWMAVVDLWPASSRPYIGGSTDNTVWDLVIGYNGLGRIFGAGGGGRGGANFGGEAGAGRMFNEIMAGQISWLLPFCALAVLVAALSWLLTRRVTGSGAAWWLWGGWLAVHLAVFSFSSGGFHPYYTTAMTPAVAALAGMGGVQLWRAYRASRAWAWGLPLGVALTGAWAFVVLRRTPDFVPWLAWAVAGGTAAAVVILVAARVTRRGLVRLAAAGAVAGLLAGLAGPAAYAVTPVGQPINGTNPLAGPASGQTGLPGGMRGGEGPPQRSGREAGSGLVSYLTAHQGGATWLAAVPSAQQASSIILATGRPVIAMGGFTGRDPAMTVDRLRELVASGRLRYVLTGGGGPGGASSEVTSWVQANCPAVTGQDGLYDCS